MPNPAPSHPLKETIKSIPLPPQKNKHQLLKHNEEIKLKYNSQRTIKVKSGDTVHSIARQMKVSIKKVINLNKLKPPYQLYVGQNLILPVFKTYIVKRGDNLHHVSKKFSVDIKTLIKVNNLKYPYGLLTGKVLRIPNKTTNLNKSNFSQVFSYLEKPNLRERPKRSVNQRFVWPLKGKIIRTYGLQDGGFFNEGINILAPLGTRINAVADGDVAYAGNDLDAYGNLLLIRHLNGWMSAYAHNETLLVELGDYVTSGQKVATLGNTGNVTIPQFHFELRQSGKSVNPLLYLK